jgi:hypothetical protein
MKCPCHRQTLGRNVSGSRPSCGIRFCLVKIIRSLNLEIPATTFADRPQDRSRWRSKCSHPRPDFLPLRHGEVAGYLTVRLRPSWLERYGSLLVRAGRPSSPADGPSAARPGYSLLPPSHLLFGRGRVCHKGRLACCGIGRAPHGNAWAAGLAQRLMQSADIRIGAGFPSLRGQPVWAGSRLLCAREAARPRDRCLLAQGLLRRRSTDREDALGRGSS